MILKFSRKEGTEFDYWDNVEKVGVSNHKFNFKSEEDFRKFTNQHRLIFDNVNWDNWKSWNEKGCKMATFSRTTEKALIIIAYNTNLDILNNEGKFINSY